MYVVCTPRKSRIVRNGLRRKTLFWLCCLLSVPSVFSESATTVSTIAADSIHQVTLFLFPTQYPLDWTSPASLYETTARCFYKSIGQEDLYLIGHAALRLRSPLLPGERHLAMTAADKQQRIDLVLKDRIGLGILGAALKGKLEDESRIRHMIGLYAGRKKLTFITFKVSEKAMQRMLRFVEAFQHPGTDGRRPCDFYGGEYWPLYYEEGAGCTAFALGTLAASGLLPDEAESWKVKVNIPMNLVGGEFRQNKKVSFRKILKTKSWYSGDGQANIDFVRHQIYDPSMAYNWVMSRLDPKDSLASMRTDFRYLPVEENGISGLQVDLSHLPVPPDDVPIFETRPEPDLFIDSYRQKRFALP